MDEKDANNIREEQQYYRQMLERVAGDHAALDMVQNAVYSLDDDDSKLDIIQKAMEMYEATRLDIAAKLMEKLG